jgi:hypothetical protein
MSKLNVIKRKGLTVFPALENKHVRGTFVVVTKCRAGYPTISTVEANSAYEAFSRYKRAAVMNVSFLSKEGFHFTMYARMGKKVWISEEIAEHLTVGDINDGGVMVNTSLYSQEQYQAVNAKTWADKVFVMNENNLEKVV